MLVLKLILTLPEVLQYLDCFPFSENYDNGGVLILTR